MCSCEKLKKNMDISNYNLTGQTNQTIFYYKSPKFLIFDFPYPQDVITIVTQNYSQLRHFHGKPPYPSAAVQICLLIASGLNASLISNQNSNSDTKEIREVLEGRLHPTVSPFQSFVMSSSIPANLRPKVTLVQIGIILYNFAYCDVPTAAHEKADVIKVIFLDSADLEVWIYVGISITLVSFLSQIDWKHKRGLIITFFGQLGSSLHRSLSALLTPGLSEQSACCKKYSPSFIIWMSMCVVLNIYYSGSVTSVLIRPAQEIRLTRMVQLAESEYTLIDLSKSRLAILKAVVQREVKATWNNSVELKKLIKIKKMVDSSIEMTHEEFNSKLTTGNKYATITEWPGAIYAANNADARLKSLKNMRKDIHPNKQCYVGKELLFPEMLYFAFIPPGNVKTAKIFQNLIEVGFYKIWEKEFVGYTTSVRVQGRSRVVDPITRLEDDKKPEALGFGGRLKSVFMLWIYGVFFCVFNFMVEFIFRFVINYRQRGIQFRFVSVR